jgi:hypothetical protein
MSGNKGDHADYCCHRRRGQQVCGTYLSQLGISDGGTVQDEALWKVLQTQVPQRLNDLFFPTKKPLKIPLHTLSLSKTLLLQAINTTQPHQSYSSPWLLDVSVDWPFSGHCQPHKHFHTFYLKLFLHQKAHHLRSFPSAPLPASPSLPTEFLRDS